MVNLLDLDLLPFSATFRTTVPLPCPVVDENEYQSSEVGFSIFQLPVVNILTKN